jgi:NAD(P)-dependent dehydrogenase (short-subunit alcohol dehydrogenase family)
MDGRVAVVTGGGTGIGLAIARQLAGAGAHVVVVGRRAEKLDEAVALIAADGSSAAARAANVRDADAVEALVDAVVAEHGRIDVVVNNAGGQFLAPVLETSVNGWRAVIDLNLNGTFNMVHAAGRHMVGAGRGAILNIVTAASLKAAPGRAHSAAARSGVMSLTRSVAAEWGPSGVRVNALAPGPVRTDALFAELGGDDVARREAELAALVPMGRMGSPEEVAGIAHFLVSDAAAFISGEVLAVDGGGWSGERLTEHP